MLTINDPHDLLLDEPTGDFSELTEGEIEALEMLLCPMR